MGTPKSETVILLHGMGPTVGNMALIAKTLVRAGYDTLNINYPSSRHTIEASARWLDKQEELGRIWDGHSRVHFVTMSLGGLVLRQYLETHRNAISKENMGRVVMLGPPYGGSEIADLLSGIPLLGTLMGPAGKQLTTAARSLDETSTWYELGIIAGRLKTPSLLGYRIIDRDHDGCVPVESTKIEGMSDHIIVSANHFFMGWNTLVRQQIVNFLHTGAFDHG